MKRTRIRVVGVSDTSEQKQEIQYLVREIVIKRDGGCILSDKYGHQCSGYRNGGELIYQADHLVTRANSATYADTRLIVCICKGLHGWKKWHEAEYNEMVRKVISKQRVALWDRCEADRRSHKTRKMDWKLEILALKQELASLEKKCS
jgi:hypothetical protein